MFCIRIPYKFYNDEELRRISVDDSYYVGLN